MYLAAEETASAVDPLFALLIGALGASVIGLLGAWIQSRREHAKWLRERRYEAYRAFMVDMDAFRDLVRKEVTLVNAIAVNKRANALSDRFSASFEAVSLLGPRKVNAAGTRWIWAANDLKSSATSKAFDDARWQFLIAAGGELRSANITAVPMTKEDEPSGERSNVRAAE